MLLAKHSGATACLICLEKVRVTDPIWDCKTGCHAVFHLLCIQSWAQQALGTAAVHSLGQLSGQHFPMAAAEAEEKARWHCPKCRSEYSKSELPREYRCFCGKQADPVNDPWLAPHTCGDKCERPLPGDCGHNCVLLCHPGPCPTCPQLLMFRYGFDYMLVLIFVDLHNLLPILNLLQGCEKLVFELFSCLCSTCHRILKFRLSV